MDPTNNVAEQAIRFIVIDRYVTQGTRSVTFVRSSTRLRRFFPVLIYVWFPL